MKIRNLLLPGFLVLCSAAALAQAAPKAVALKVDPAHSVVEFNIRHLISRVTGDFTGFSGEITVPDPSKPDLSSVSFSIDAASIDTRIAARDNHLRSADFFDVAKFPKITFTSTKVISKGNNQYDVTGSFTMHGVTKQITLPVTFNGTAKDPWGHERAGFSVKTSLNRKDYGIVWNQTLDQGGVMLGDDVEITIDIEAVVS